MAGDRDQEQDIQPWQRGVLDVFKVGKKSVHDARRDTDLLGE